MRIFLVVVLTLILFGACGEEDLDFPGSVPDATSTPVSTGTPSGTGTPTRTPTATPTTP